MRRFTVIIVVSARGNIIGGSGDFINTRSISRTEHLFAKRIRLRVRIPGFTRTVSVPLCIERCRSGTVFGQDFGNIIIVIHRDIGLSYGIVFQGYAAGRQRLIICGINLITVAGRSIIGTVRGSIVFLFRIILVCFITSAGTANRKEHNCQYNRNYSFHYRPP